MKNPFSFSFFASLATKSFDVYIINCFHFISFFIISICHFHSNHFLSFTAAGTNTHTHDSLSLARSFFGVGKSLTQRAFFEFILFLAYAVCGELGREMKNCVQAKMATERIDKEKNIDDWLLCLEL
jgi:hypothetical protein